MIFSCSKDGIIKITVLKWQMWFGDEAREKIRQLGHQDRNLGSLLVHLQAMLYGPLWHLRLFYQPCCYLTYLRNELKACGEKKGCGILAHIIILAGIQKILQWPEELYSDFVLGLKD